MTRAAHCRPARAAQERARGHAHAAAAVLARGAHVVVWGPVDAEEGAGGEALTLGARGAGGARVARAARPVVAALSTRGFENRISDREARVSVQGLSRCVAYVIADAVLGAVAEVGNRGA